MKKLKIRWKNAQPLIKVDRWVMAFFVAGVVMSIANLALGFAAVSSPFGWSIVLIMVGWTRAYMIARAYKTYVQKREPKAAKTDAYCGSCGQAYIEWTQQIGFSRRTGQPRVDTVQGCPDWDEAKWNQRRSMNLYPYSDTIPPRDCENRVVSKLERQIDLHNGHGAGQVDTTCRGCIEDMVKVGVLDRSAANTMISYLS